MCGADVSVSESKLIASCEYCGSQMKLENAAPEANISQAQANEYKLILVDSGAEKIRVIKIIRDITGAGLAEAKNAADFAPTLIATSSEREQMTLHKSMLENAGATVQLLPVEHFAVVRHTLGEATPKQAGEKKGCYVATAIYGSYNCPQVWTLRRFRDDVLGKSWYGRMFIRVYYTSSPFAVKWFGRSEWFCGLCKKVLDGFVMKLRGRGVSDLFYED